MLDRPRHLHLKARLVDKLKMGHRGEQVDSRREELDKDKVEDKVKLEDKVYKVEDKVNPSPGRRLKVFKADLGVLSSSKDKVVSNNPGSSKVRFKPRVEVGV